MGHESFISTGLTGLERALGDTLTPGHVIGAIGASGSGKTILAAQITRHAVEKLPPDQIHFFTTEVQLRELWNRILSAALSIPYTAFYGNENEKYLRRTSGDGQLWPNPQTFSTAEIIRAKDLSSAFHSIGFTHLKGLDLDLAKELKTSIEEFRVRLDGRPGLFILDFLNKNSFQLDEFAARQAMQDSMDVLNEATSQGDLLTIVFAQAMQARVGKRHLDLDDIADCKGLFASADAFIGIGQEAGEDPPEEEGVGPPPMYRRSQSLNILFPKGGGSPTRVPVTRRFEFQRFEDRIEPKPQGGYLPFSRERFRNLCALRAPNAINVYAYLALQARSMPGDRLLGSSWPSHETISESTGLSIKRVRLAVDKLVKGELLKKTRTPNRSNKYRILGWTAHHTAEGAASTKEGYFQLYRKIREPGIHPLFSHPATLRLWLYILANAQIFTHRTHWEIHQGRISLDFDKVEHEIGLSVEDTEEALTILEERRSIEILEGERVMNLIRIVNWDQYRPDT